jgi:NADH-quinone oxidoreductase subunit N
MGSIPIEDINKSLFKGYFYFMDSIILKSFIPEIFLSLSILFQLIFNARLVNNLKFNFPVIDQETFWQTSFILFCVILLLSNMKIEGMFSTFLFLNDESGRIVKIVLLLSSVLGLFVIFRSFTIQNLNFFEYFSIFLLSILALMLLVSSSDLISAYLVIEMQALCFYILASFRRDSAFSTEAGLKYFISGAFISGIFLFGASLIYGGLGTLNFNHISLLLSFPLEDEFSHLKMFVLIGVLMVTITLLFKVAAAPFHFWSPDVYEGSPLSSTVIFSIVPKIVIFSFFIKWVSIISTLFIEVKDFFILVGIISVFTGTFFALRQKRMKRLIIFSSIAQVGFLVAALSTNSVDGFASIYFFLIIYILTSILVWNHVSLFYSFQKEIKNFSKIMATPLFLSSLSNFFKYNGLWAFSFILMFFSIAGIPPLSGFLSKIFILFGLINSNQLIGAISLIMISAISVFYYIRVIKVVFFESKEAKARNDQFQTIFTVNLFDFDCLVISICLFCLVYFFFYPSTLLLLCQYIVLSSFWF